MNDKTDMLILRAPTVTVAHAATDAPTMLREYVLIPDGRFKSKNGEFTLDAAGAAAIIKAFAAQAIDLVVDYEHQTMGEQYSSPDGTAPAAGWIKTMRYERGKGLLGTIHWTAKAAERIRTGEYKYMSPVVAALKTNGRVVGLHSVALTNVPAIAGYPELVAASPPKHRRYLVMADAPQNTGQSAETLVTNLRTLLGLPDTATAEQVLAAALEALTSMQSARANTAKALGLAETAKGEEIVTAINKVKETNGVPKDQWVKVNANAEALRGRVQELQLRANKAEAANLIGRFGKEGKLTTAMAEHELKVLTANVEQFDARKGEFEARMAIAPVVVPLGKTTPPADGGGPPSDRATIIAKAGKEYDGEPQLKALTSRVAVVDDALRTQRLPLLTDEEKKAMNLTAA